MNNEGFIEVDRVEHDKSTPVGESIASREGAAKNFTPEQIALFETATGKGLIHVPMEYILDSANEQTIKLVKYALMEGRYKDVDGIIDAAGL